MYTHPLDAHRYELRCHLDDANVKVRTIPSSLCLPSTNSSVCHMDDANVKRLADRAGVKKGRRGRKEIEAVVADSNARLDSISTAARNLIGKNHPSSLCLPSTNSPPTS